MKLIKKIIFRFLQRIPSLPYYWMSEYVGKATNYFYLKMRFETLVGYYPNIKSPRSFNEKILYRKLFERDSRIPELVDKIAVREYVTKKIGKRYLVPLIGTYGSAKTIDFNMLPDKCVLKTNFMSGGNIFLDNNKLNDNEVLSKLEYWMKSPFRHKELVWFVQKINRKILAEEMLYDASTNSLPYDYKFFMFKGVELFIQVDMDRFKDHKRNFYDANWNRVDFTLRYNSGPDVKKPENFDEMLSVARKLSEDFAFVRVDLYTIGSRIYFGELTFTPEDGSSPFTPVSYDYLLGDKWVLSSVPELSVG